CTSWRMLVAFFFSSRRRHTSSKRDWSSDVCSSDLEVEHVVELTFHILQRLAGQRLYLVRLIVAYGHQDAPEELVLVGIDRDAPRSEERRVGKECRSRWGTEDGGEKERRRRCRRQSG